MVHTGPDAAVYMFLYKSGLDEYLYRIIHQATLQSHTVNMKYFIDSTRNIFPQRVI
jgi:hypothetical protein